jgi:subtilase family serine protease
MTPRVVVDGTVKPVGHYTGTIKFVIGLKPPHKAEEERFVQEVQDPTSPRFHMFLSPEEWNARFAPSEEDEQAVLHWAASNDIRVTQRYPNRLIIDMEAPAETIEKAFDVTINRYEANGEVDYSNDRDPTLPPELDGIIASVTGLNNIDRLHPAGAMPHSGR